MVALHVGPAAASVPRPQSFALLYHVLEIIPAYRCVGVTRGLVLMRTLGLKRGRQYFAWDASLTPCNALLGPSC